MKDIITLVLLPEDFNTLTDTKKIRDQFINNLDCPIARATKRQFPKDDVSVNHIAIYINSDTVYFPMHESRKIGISSIFQYAALLQDQSKILIKCKLK